MISVVMSVYNPNEFFEQQLDSIRLQSREPDEVIFVDDASSNDGMIRLENYIEKHGLRHWKTARQKENRGFVQTFRHALALADGDLIILCDQDDIWEPDKVRTIETVFRENPQTGALVTSYIPIDENGEVIPGKPQKGKSNNNLIRREVVSGALNRLEFSDLAIYNVSPGCTAALSAEIRDKYLKWDGGLPHDWAIYAIAALEGRLYYLDQPLTRYRQHASNTIGLKHLSKADERARRSASDWLQKKAMVSLVHRFKSGSAEEEEARLAEQWFEARKNYLERRKLLDAVSLMAEAGRTSFFYETIGSDIRAILEERGIQAYGAASKAASKTGSLILQTGRKAQKMLQEQKERRKKNEEESRNG